MTLTKSLEHQIISYGYARRITDSEIKRNLQKQMPVSVTLFSNLKTMLHFFLDLFFLAEISKSLQMTIFSPDMDRVRLMSHASCSDQEVPEREAR